MNATAVQVRAAKRAFFQHWNRLAAFAHPSSKLNMKKQNKAKAPLSRNKSEVDSKL
jgi:hypothetical protein